MVDRRPQVAERAVRLGPRLRPRCGGPPRGDDPRRRVLRRDRRAASATPTTGCPESSRRARGFAVLAALRSLGRSGLVDLIERDCALARRMAGAARRRPAGPDPQRGRAQPGPRPVRRRSGRRRRIGRRRADARRHRRRPARRHVLARRDDVGRSRRDARLGLRLADDRGRHRPVGRRDPARARDRRRRRRASPRARAPSSRPSATSRCAGRR